MINKEELEKRRTPAELREYVSSTFDKIKSEPAEKKRARLKEGLYKEFIEELYPLDIFTSWKYPRYDIEVGLVIGSQGYDAVIYDSNGDEISHVEITWPIDGHRQKQQAQLLNDRGYGEAEISDDPLVSAMEVMKRVYGVAVKKSVKDYSGLNGASLVILIDVYPHFYLDDPEHERELNSFITRLKSLNYQTENVYLVLMPFKKVISIFES
jgi:hypothetical protein